MTQRASPVKYNLDLLIKFCNENHITLLKDYSGEKVNLDIRIIAKCINCDNKMVEKTFGKLLKNKNFGCKECSKYFQQEKTNKTCLEKYGVSTPLQSQEVKDKIKATFLEKYGVEHPMFIKETKDKIKATCLEKYGVEYSLQSQDVREKGKASNMKKYGVENSMQSHEVREKSKVTNLEKYGVESPLQNKEVMKKVKSTNLEKYGVENPSQNKEIKSKKVDTCFKNYGVENPSQSNIVKSKKVDTCFKNWGVEHPSQAEEVREKGKVSCLEKYGVEYAMQNPDIADKSSKASYSRKDYTLPSGKIIQVQGYEHYALDELVKIFNEDEIKTGSGSVPEIWYDDDEGLKHRHFVDIFIPSQNKCIEVKSTWTAEKKKDYIFKKQQAGKHLGYNYEIWIYNSKGEKVECIV